VVPLQDDNKRIFGWVSVVRDITEKVEAERELHNSREQLRKFSTYLQSVREEERKSFAREIHDELGQALTALKMDTSWLGKKIPSDRQSIHEKIKSMGKLINTTIQSVKRISTELRPGLLDDLGLASAMEWQADEFQKRTGISCELVMYEEDIVQDPAFSTDVFRIFQEALTNIARHSKATKVMASLELIEGNLILTVSDNGKGITEDQISNPNSFGLIGMKERAHRWNGTFEISGRRDQGTTITLSIPLYK
jgi:signal transduction histidine kinase